jgi:hypothetical protein
VLQLPYASLLDLTHLGVALLDNDYIG